MFVREFKKITVLFLKNEYQISALRASPPLINSKEIINLLLRPLQHLIRRWTCIHPLKLTFTFNLTFLNNTVVKLNKCIRKRNVLSLEDEP
jgi:hypothetical protein